MEKDCLHCGNKFSKKQVHSTKYWEKAKYCSRKCSLYYTSKNLSRGSSKGKKLKISPEGLAKKKLLASGSNNYFWKGGVSDLKRQIINLHEYRHWRSSVYSRDNYTCQTCLEKGGELECHHINAFSKILKQNNITSTEEALECSELWNINNGQTLCKDCHKNTPNYGTRATLQHIY
jgi:hypothetical protein